MDRANTVKPARPDDRGAILDVMRPWNMHHVPSPEMEELDIACFFVARVDGQIVGAASYKVISQTVGKTTHLGVLPEHGNLGIGSALQDARLEAMGKVGVKTVITNADRPATIDWYKRKYGYRDAGTLKKVCAFGDPEVDHWTTIEMDLAAWMQKRDRDAAVREAIARHEPHPLSPYPPLLINACLTGMVPTKDKSSHVPVNVEEIVADAVRVADAGAQIVHVHARDDNGQPTWKASVYERIVTGIRHERPALIV